MHTRNRIFILVLAGFLMVVALGYASAQAPGASGCPVFVETALIELEENCSDLGRNTACYGYYRVHATFTEEMEVGAFNQPADEVDLAMLASITTAPFDADTEEWGIAVLNVQANVPNTMPGQAVKFVLMGDATLSNAVDPENTLTPADPIEITLSDQANLRSGPSLNANVLLTVSEDSVLLADGISPDGQWLRVFYERSNMWVSQQVVNPVDVSGLPEIGENAYTPMQAFYFTTGIGNPTCNEAPDMLVVQGPDSVLVDLNVNGANITVGSTAVFTSANAPAGDDTGSQCAAEEGALAANLQAIDGLNAQLQVVADEISQLEAEYPAAPEGDGSDIAAWQQQMGNLENQVAQLNQQLNQLYAQQQALVSNLETCQNVSGDTGQDGADARSQCDLVRIRVLSGAVLLNRGTIVLPEGYRAISAICDADEEDTGAPQPETTPEPDGDNAGTSARAQGGGVQTSDWVVTGEMGEDDQGDVDTVQNLPEGVTNYTPDDPDPSGAAPVYDDDADGIPNERDNCPNVPNTLQIDSDGDGTGDLCDEDTPVDTDGDGVPDDEDNCVRVENPRQADDDGDGRGNLCDRDYRPDADEDGVTDAVDNCPDTRNTPQRDVDQDGMGDACDPDDDNDGIPDEEDNCRRIPNPEQNDLDGDGSGNICDLDDDGDDVPDRYDSCRLTWGTSFRNLVGCPDTDGDGWADREDNCPEDFNRLQNDPDGDGLGNACDPDDDNDGFRDVVDECRLQPGEVNGCPEEGADSDGDGVPDSEDNCPENANVQQIDLDHDGLGNACDDDDDGDGFSDAEDSCRLVYGTSFRSHLGCPDADEDGWADGEDNCPDVFNREQNDPDGDGLGNACDDDDDGDGFADSSDSCRLEYGTSTRNLQGCPDSDGDGWADSEDNCPSEFNAPQIDLDKDGLGNDCDDDDDGDGFLDVIDSCRLIYGTSNRNLQGCPDSDGDGWADSEDNCPYEFNAPQNDLDGDGLGNDCDDDDDGDGFADNVDSCRLEYGTSFRGWQGCPDSDGDGWADGQDNCPSTYNEQQNDTDSDGMGNACDPDDDNDGYRDENDSCRLEYGTSNRGLQGCPDSDGDGWADVEDNCPSVSNVQQNDTDGDGAGNICDDDDDNDGFPDVNDSCRLIPGTSFVNLTGCPDSDGDGWADSEDNCPSDANPGQADNDGDGIGNVCDPTP